MKKTTQLALIPEVTEPKADTFKSWALVELFGHQRIVGWVTVDPVDFPGMIRVDVPDLKKDGEVIRAGGTRYFGKAALYGVTPVSEKAMLQMLPSIDGAPGQARVFGRDREDW
jgi:hypothetical protein